MTKWISKDIIAKLMTCPNVTGVRSITEGGDYDTEWLVITTTGTDNLHTFGFVCDTKQALEPKDNVEVEMVELSDGMDSRGGLNSDDVKTGYAYAEIKSTLSDMGFTVVSTMENYF